MSFEWLAFVPIWAVRLGILLFLGSILVWIWKLPGSYILKDAPGPERWRDIRWWALVIFLVLGLTTVLL